MFLWRADTLATRCASIFPTLLRCSKRLLPLWHAQVRGHISKLYPKCENISIDYAVLEPRSAKGEGQSRIFCLPSDFGWNDLGSWTSLHEHTWRR